MNIPKDNVRKIHFIYSILLSISIIIAGFCLIVSCIDIYHMGDEPFTRASVADAFSKIAVPVYLCLFMTIIGFVLDIIYFENSSKVKNSPNYGCLLIKMYDKRDIEHGDLSLVSDINNIKNKRKLLRNINIIIIALCSIVFLIYALNINNFPMTNDNSPIIKAMYVLIPCTLISFGYSLFFLYYNEKSIKKELELVKQLPVKEVSNIETRSNTDITKIKYVILLLSIVLLIYGIYTGGTADVLTKAVNICTECIGLG